MSESFYNKHALTVVFELWIVS